MRAEDSTTLTLDFSCLMTLETGGGAVHRSQVGHITTLPHTDRLPRLFHPQGLAEGIAAAHA